jgi:hypothetical protein
MRPRVSDVRSGNHCKITGSPYPTLVGGADTVFGLASGTGDTEKSLQCQLGWTGASKFTFKADPD